MTTGPLLTQRGPRSDYLNGFISWDLLWLLRKQWHLAVSNHHLPGAPMSLSDVLAKSALPEDVLQTSRL